MRNGYPIIPQGPALSFEEAFPDVEEVRVEVREFNGGIPEPVSALVYATGLILPGEWVSCSNPFCRCEGQSISIGGILRKTIRERMTECETQRDCRGAEKVGRGPREPCNRWFRVNLRLRYKEQFQNEQT
jgi:hypothetical protein